MKGTDAKNAKDADDVPVVPQVASLGSSCFNNLVNILFQINSFALVMFFECLYWLVYLFGKNRDLYFFRAGACCFSAS